jgi:LmbE family N-acetylglucosaminyl deacetylase
MVMSGSGERVVFVYDRPGSEALVTGGTIARLRSDDAQVVVLFGARAAAVGTPGGVDTDAGDTDYSDTDYIDTDGAEVRAAMAELDVTDWRMLPPASGHSAGNHADRHALAAAVRDVVAEVEATAVVLGTDDDRLYAAATEAADALGVPVFMSRRVSDAIGQRLIAIDVSDQVERKLRAIAAYPRRWSVTDHSVLPVVGAESAPAAAPTMVGGTETYVRHDPPPRSDAAARPGPAARVMSGVLALAGGSAFGLLGTIAHQATVSIGPVTIPIGLILALSGVTALLAGLRLVLGDRMIVLLCAIGLLGTIFVLSLRSTGGSVLVPEGLPGVLWTVVPTLVATLVLAWPRIPARHGSA